MRIGHGFDVHALAVGRPCIIGGVNVPYAKGLDGHSDADVLLHAICDALLGAAALGDIGQHFRLRMRALRTSIPDNCCATCWPCCMSVDIRW